MNFLAKKIVEESEGQNLKKIFSPKGDVKVTYCSSSTSRIVKNTLMFCFRQILIMASQQFKESASCEG